MKTPEEIKKALECCIRGDNATLDKCGSVCPYYIENHFLCGITNMMKDALAYIEQLEEQLANRDNLIDVLED